MAGNALKPLVGVALALSWPFPALAQPAGPQPTVAAENPTERAFRQLSDHWLAETLRLNPVAATQAGEHRYDALLPDIGPTGRAPQLRLAQDTLAALMLINRDRLSRASQVDSAMLETQLRYDLFQLQKLEEHAWNPLAYTGGAGSALYGLMAREFAPLPVRLRAATRRMERLPEWLATARRQLDPARVPLVHAETAVRQNAGLASIIDGMILPEAGKLPAAEQARLKRAAERLKAASAEHGEWLKSTLVPAAKGDWRIGARLYDEKLALALNSPLSRAELRTRAEAMIARTREEM